MCDNLITIKHGFYFVCYYLKGCSFKILLNLIKLHLNAFYFIQAIKTKRLKKLKSIVLIKLRTCITNFGKHHDICIKFALSSLLLNL